MNGSQEHSKRDRRPPGRRFTNSLRVDGSFLGNPALLPPLLQQTNFTQLFADNLSLRSEHPFARFREITTGEIKLISWHQAGRDVLAIAHHLRERCGVKRGDCVAIFASTRYEWVVADLAILALGAVSVSIYHSLTPAEAGFILWDSKVKVVFAENEEQIGKLQQLLNAPFIIPETEKHPGGEVTIELNAIVSFETIAGGKIAKSQALFEDITRGTDSHATADTIAAELRALTPSISSKDLASIVYTSGTTGAPKGVLQTHGNHLSMLDSVMGSGLLGTGERIFLYLPLAHSFARLIAYSAIGPGGDMIFPAVIDHKRYRFNPSEILKDLKNSEPLVFPSVPRLFEKIMEGIQTRRGFGGSIARWAIQTMGTVTQPRFKIRPWHRPKIALARRVTKKIKRSIFGPQLRYCVSGGAPISLGVLEFFRALDVLICEGYGLTETCPAIGANIPSMLRFGTIGRPFDCNEIKIDETDGEILARGANVALGYLDRPKATAESWDAEGWFRTGDIGEIDEDGYLKITDRKKDIIVTAGGKKIPPALLEGRLKDFPHISHALVYGDKHPYLVALITLNEPAIRDWLKAKGWDGSLQNSEIAKHKAVNELINSYLNDMNSSLASYEQIKRFRILSEDFTLENSCLTPSLKMKRKFIIDRFSEEIATLYHSRDSSA